MLLQIPRSGCGARGQLPESVKTTSRYSPTVVDQLSDLLGAASYAKPEMPGLDGRALA